MRYIYSLILLLIIYLQSSCQSTTEPAYKNILLLEPTTCIAPITIVEENYFQKVNKSKDLNNLAYSTTYTLFHSSTDSIEKNEARYAIANNAQDIIQSSINGIKILNSTTLLNKNYREVMLNTSEVKNRDYNAIKNLTIESDFEKQLFVEIRAYPKQNENKYSINMYIFDILENDLLYFYNYSTSCDVRDSKNFTVILGHGLSQLQQDVANKVP